MEISDMTMKVTVKIEDKETIAKLQEVKEAATRLANLITELDLKKLVTVQSDSGGNDYERNDFSGQRKASEGRILPGRT